MKTAKLIELERGRIDLVDEARDLLRQMDGETDIKKMNELGRKHDAAMRSLDLNKLDQDEESLSADDEEARAARRPKSNGEASGTDSGNAVFGVGSDWVDKRGEPVRVLARDQKISERSNTGLSLGDMVRAKILGPRNESEKRALSEGTDSAGGFTVPTPLASQFIDLMRAKSVAVRAGAMTVPMESETLAIARLASDPTVGWRAENAAIVEGDPTFDRVTFTAHTLAGRISLSRELMEDSLNVGAMIENAFAQSMALELDRAAIWGDGTGNSPTGVVNTAGINTVSMGTNGVALTNYDKLIDAVYEMQLDNADDPTAMIMHPRTQAALAKLKDGQGNPLTVPAMIARIPGLATTAAPIDEVEGTATDASSIVFGNYRDLLLGVRHQLEFRLFDSPLATTGQILAVAWMRADVQLARPKSFAPLTGIIPA